MFYVQIDGQTRGPYVLDQIQSMWASGIITADALYRDGGGASWRPMIELISVKLESRPPSPPAAAPLVPPATWPKTMQAQEKVTPDGEPSNTIAWDSAKPRPWRRLFARYLDLQILGAIPLSITAPILLHFFPSPLPDAWTFLGGLGICFAVALESLFLSRLATTPGKWLLGISVREGDGRKLTPLHAQKRAISATFRAVPISLPLFGPLAYRDLKKRGATKWDRKGGYIVTHSPISEERWFASISLVVIFIAGYWVAISELVALEQKYTTPDANTTAVVDEAAQREAKEQATQDQTISPPSAPSPTPEQAVNLPSDQLNQVQGLSVDAAQGLVAIHNDSDFRLMSVDFAINLYSASGAYLNSYHFHATTQSPCEPHSQGGFLFTPFDNAQVMSVFRDRYPTENWNIVSASGIKP